MISGLIGLALILIFAVNFLFVVLGKSKREKGIMFLVAMTSLYILLVYV